MEIPENPKSKHFNKFNKIRKTFFYVALGIHEIIIPIHHANAYVIDHKAAPKSFNQNRPIAGDEHLLQINE